MRRALLAISAVSALLAIPANAQQYKYETPMPPGVVSPDTVETSFGTLRFFGGVPDEASTAKIYDNLDLQRAVQAYLLALPVVNQVGNRAGILQIGPANTTVPIWDQMVDSRTVELTANDNTPYTWFWVDPSNGPLVIEAPPKVLGLVDDIWYHWAGDIGITGPDKGAGGKYPLLPPGYKGAAPDGYFVMRPGSFSVWAGWRSFVINGDPKPGVDIVKKITKIYPLSQAANPPPLNYVNMSGKPLSMVAPADYRFWDLLNQVVQEEPTDTVGPTTLGFWASIGIVKGKPFAPDERMKKILTEAAAVGDATGRALAYRMRQKAAYYFDNRSWKHAFIGGYKFEEQPGVANLDASAMFFFAATGVTPAMDTQIETRSMVQTDQQYPSVSSQTKGLLVNADGSIDIYFGPKAPAGEANNWVQTIPGKAWFTLLRLYGPLEPWFNQTWRPDDIVLQRPS